MSRRQYKSLSSLFFGVITIVLFQNCGKSFTTINAVDGGSISSASSAAQIKPVCVDPDDVGASDSSRMAKHQLINTLTDLFGSNIMQQASVVTAVGIVPDDGGARNNRYLSSNITNEHMQSYIDLGFEVAQAVFNNTTLKTTVFGSCASATTISATCIDTYLNNFATKIFRRPLNSAEIQSAKSLYTKSVDPKEGFVNVLAMQLASPSFLYVWEVGSNSDTQPYFQISNYELAARLSFAITDSTPDDTLLTLAKSGQIQSDTVLKSEARRLALTNRGKYKIKQMFYGWLEAKDTFDYSNFGASFLQGINTNGLDQAAIAEMDQFLDQIIFKQNGTYQDLMNSNISFASNASLAAIYGHAPVTTAPAAMPAGRKGILARLPYLFSQTTRSDIIIRGVTFQRNILCQNLPSPPPQIINSRSLTDLTEQEILALSNRQWIEHRTSNVSCAGCHGLINPPGYAFEKYDSLGRMRTQENIYDQSLTLVNTMPVDTRADVPMWNYKVTSFNDANDLASWVANSPDGQTCLAKNIYEYMHSRGVDNHDGCQVDQAIIPLQTAGGSILDSFINAAVNRGIHWKRTQ